MQDYVMSDSFLPMSIDTTLTKKLVNSGITSAQYPPNLRPGTTVIIKIGGKAAARASIVSIGEHSGKDGGESRMWGNLYIGAKKATVRLISVLLPGVKVPFQHEDWGQGKITLGEAFNTSKDHVLAVHTSQIHALYSPDRVNQPSKRSQVHNGASISAGASPSTTSNESMNLRAKTDTTQVAASNKPDGSDDELEARKMSAEELSPSQQLEQPTDKSEPDKSVEFVNVDSDDVEVEEDNLILIRSRIKSDQWHEFDNLRSVLGKNCPALPAITRLCRVATTSINAKEEDAVVAVLKNKGIEDPHEHFMFHREYHLSRVRCPPRKGDEASHLVSGLNHT